MFVAAAASVGDRKPVGEALKAVGWALRQANGAAPLGGAASSPPGGCAEPAAGGSSTSEEQCTENEK